MERGHSFDYMQTDKDFFSPEYIRHILVKLRPWKGLVLISRLVGVLAIVPGWCANRSNPDGKPAYRRNEKGGYLRIAGKSGVFSIHLSESMRYFGRRVCLLDFRTKAFPYNKRTMDRQWGLFSPCGSS